MSGWSREKKTKVHQFLQLPEAHKYIGSNEEVDSYSTLFHWRVRKTEKIKIIRTINF